MQQPTVHSEQINIPSANAVYGAAFVWQGGNTVWPALILFAASGLIASTGAPAWWDGLVWLAAASVAAAYIYARRASTEPDALVPVQAGRILAANALLVFFFSLVTFILSLFLVIFSVILVVASGYDPSSADADDVNASLDALRQSGAIWILYLAISAGALFYAWLVMRLILVGAATFNERRLMVFRTWDWTKDYVRVILSISLLTWVPASIVACAVTIASPSEFRALVFGTAIIPAFYLFHTLARLMLRPAGPDEQLR